MRLAAQVDYLPPADAALVAELMPGATFLEGGVRFLVKQEGEGPLIRPGDTVTALYIGRLLDGTIFNQKRSRFHSYRFRVGAHPRQIIRGWEVALPHMRDGGTYLVAIPSVLGYRERGRPGQVPPHTTITFEIEIIGVERGATPATSPSAPANN
jgi:FKBP-type peptidyl-prolyl cis-trans isomerase